MKEPDEWLFQPSWLKFINWFLRRFLLRAYLAVTPGCKIRLRITRLGRPAKKDK